jgi:hypothetical protein
VCVGALAGIAASSSIACAGISTRLDSERSDSSAGGSTAGAGGNPIDQAGTGGKPVDDCGLHRPLSEGEASALATGAMGFGVQVKERHVAGLWEALQLQFFHAQTGSYEAFVGHGDEFVALSQPHYGYHFLSAAVLGEELFYTYTSGSGFIVARIGRIRLLRCVIDRLETGAFLASVDGDMYVKRSGDTIVVERGRFTSDPADQRELAFNAWDNGTWFATLSSTETSIDLIDASGNVIPPSF